MSLVWKRRLGWLGLCGLIGWFIDPWVGMIAMDVVTYGILWCFDLTPEQARKKVDA